MPSDRSRVQKCADIVLIGLFATAIGLPLVGWLTIEESTVSGENRFLAKMPTLQLQTATLCEFPGQFEAHFNDHFGCRQLLIQSLSLGRFFLGVSTNPQVVIGRDGWLYFTEEQVGRDYSSTRPLTDEQLRRWQLALEGRHAWCAARGIRYLFVVAPDKQTIYPEMLPPAIQQRQVMSHWGQLLDHLRAAGSPVNTLDLRPALWRAKENEQLYADKDSHWNDAGAHIAYQQIMTALADGRPSLQPRARADFAEAVIAHPHSDLRRLLFLKMLPSFFLCLEPRQPRQAEVVPVQLPGNWQNRRKLNQPFATEHPDRSLPRAVVFRDSFTLALAPFLSEHFRRAVYVWQTEFEPAIVELETPDFVIQEVVERSLVRPPAFSSR